MNYLHIILLLQTIIFFNCHTEDPVEDTNTADIFGFELLDDVKGHWVGDNQTAFGYFDWFAFDFRPISSSHVHSIYEGATGQNIITSIFIGEYENKLQVMARNGGWLGTQYRATYFVLDQAEDIDGARYYRLVDAVGREQRSFIEFKFENDTMYLDACKDNSGSLDEPIHHMGFKGTNYNPSFAQVSTELFDFPKGVSEVSLNNSFVDLIDPDSALFLEESKDPYPRSQHGHLSELTITINKEASIADQNLLLYLSKEPIVNASGFVDLDNIDNQVIRTISIRSDESVYQMTYLHPDVYYVTAFTDVDSNFYPSTGDVASASTMINVSPESDLSSQVDVNVVIE